MRTIESERVRKLGVDFLNRDTDAAARHLAVRHQLVFHVARDINRHRE